MKKRVIKYFCGAIMLTFLLTGCNKKDVPTESLKTEQQVENEVATTIKDEEDMKSTQLPVETQTADPVVDEVDYSSYFNGYEGSATFFNPSNNTYQIYNMEDAKKETSPCSTFKIVSTLAALENGIITKEDSTRKWSGETFWKSDWNKDMNLQDAFKASCVWYYRQLIDEIGPEEMQSFLTQLDYGNKDISDWEGKLNKNNNNRSLTGFWVESSLKISPLQQVDMLNRIFQKESIYQPANIETLMELMKVDPDISSLNIYGKTGYGKLNNISLDSWFVGMFEVNQEFTYFAVHLSQSQDPDVSSALAKEIAISIIEGEYNNRS